MGGMHGGRNFSQVRDIALFGDTRGWGRTDGRTILGLPWLASWYVRVVFFFSGLPFCGFTCDVPVCRCVVCGVNEGQ